MCKFFSCISDGMGKVLYFKVEDIAKVMSKSNPKNYEWNSHTSIAHFNGIEGEKEDKWNKWEYDPFKQSLTPGQLNAKDDSVKILPKLKKYFQGKNLEWLQNFYNENSGDWNFGNRNSGDWNSGDGNSGNRNSGNRNSGDGNFGNRNSGDGNSKTVMGHFCSQNLYFLFNKPCIKEEADKVYNLELWQYFDILVWVDQSQMTDKEKEDNPQYKIIGGYLKKKEYKEAWRDIPKEKIAEIKELKNFDKEVFKEITGLDV